MQRRFDKDWLLRTHWSPSDICHQPIQVDTDTEILKRNTQLWWAHQRRGGFLIAWFSLLLFYVKMCVELNIKFQNSMLLSLSLSLTHSPSLCIYLFHIFIVHPLRKGICRVCTYIIFTLIAISYTGISIYIYIYIYILFFCV